MPSVAGSKGGIRNKEALKLLRKHAGREGERVVEDKVQKLKREGCKKKSLFSFVGNVTIPGSEEEFKMSESFYYGNPEVKITSLTNAFDSDGLRQECVLEHPAPFKERAFQCLRLNRPADSAKRCRYLKAEFPCLNNGVGLEAETRFKEITVSLYDVYQIAKMQGQGQDGILANKGELNLFFCVVLHNCPSHWEWTLGMLTVEWYHGGWCFGTYSLYPLHYNSETYSYDMGSQDLDPTGTRVFVPTKKL